MSIFSKLWDWITGASKKVRQWLNFGKDFANTIKQFADSPLLDAVVRATPITMDDQALGAIRIYLQQFIDKMGWADKKLSDFEGDAKTAVLHLLSSVAAKAKAEAGGETIALQTTLTTQQLIYDDKAIQKDLKA